MPSWIILHGRGSMTHKSFPPCLFVAHAHKQTHNTTASCRLSVSKKSKTSVLSPLVEGLSEVLRRQHGWGHATHRLVGDLSSQKRRGQRGGDGVTLSALLCACVCSVSCREYCPFHVSSRKHELPVRSTNGLRRKETRFPQSVIFTLHREIDHKHHSCINSLSFSVCRIFLLPLCLSVIFCSAYETRKPLKSLLLATHNFNVIILRIFSEFRH